MPDHINLNRTHSDESYFMIGIFVNNNALIIRYCLMF
jgi:hypothetical protein